jgi:hypothetical protein
MAVMTGVQRSTVSVMAGTLKRAGVIDYARGHVRILDRLALQRHACECYSIIGRQFDDLRTNRGASEALDGPSPPKAAGARRL